MNQPRQVRLLVGGPANSGKSTLCTTLYRILQARSDVSVGLYEIDVYSDTHGPLLGAKPWSAREKQWHAGLPEVQAIMRLFLSDPAHIVIGDLPGNIHNPHLQVMMSGGTHAMYVGRNFDELPAWEQAFKRAEAKLAWRVQTKINGCTQPVPGQCTHVLHDLHRQLVVTDKKTQALADELVDLVKRTSP